MPSWHSICIKSTALRNNVYPLSGYKTPLNDVCTVSRSPRFWTDLILWGIMLNQINIEIIWASFHFLCEENIDLIFFMKIFATLKFPLKMLKCEIKIAQTRVNSKFWLSNVVDSWNCVIAVGPILDVSRHRNVFVIMKNVDLWQRVWNSSISTDTSAGHPILMPIRFDRINKYNVYEFYAVLMLPKNVKFKLKTVL